MAAEKQFENKIKKFLKDHGYWFVKYWGGSSFTKAGIPDILACIEGYFIGIEVKAEHGRPSDLQIYNLRKITESGGIGFLLYPKDWENFKDFVLCLEADNLSMAVKYSDEIQKTWRKYERINKTH